ncbi:hypothetical protein GS398_16205 [Pedobacter sp. HMF7056]|uniref:Terminase n=1 Tax=Hufsiella ginkgonis TaxID=2695274 RepID=A0A7K1Y2D6_9SPHI|nr:hypothetical protein [Hufsiella ginkgonis]
MNKILDYRSADPDKGWPLFCQEVLRINLDPEQEEVVRAVQMNPMVSVSSGTARGKDYVAAACAMCFMYLTPQWNEAGDLYRNTKVALTAPTDRQVKNVMLPEISRMFNRAGCLPGRLTGYDIRTPYTEWFLTGFKADEHNDEAWTGFHAANTMFVITEATGIPDRIFHAIEGNLQGNSRLLIIFNPNISIGYAAESQRSSRFTKIRLNSMTAPNVKAKKLLITGQVDWEWVNDKVHTWCSRIAGNEFNEGEGDFEWEGELWRPNDLFRVKILGMFPKVSEDTLIPIEWIFLANNRWKEWQENKFKIQEPLKLGVDVAGMGRDSTVYCHRYGNVVTKFEQMFSGGEANHMEISGRTANLTRDPKTKSFIDTIGEGAGVYSRLKELEFENAHSVKGSEGADGLKDVTNVYEFLNMRAYMMWCVRDWLNPANKQNAALPPDDELTQELSTTRYKFRSNGKIQIEEKDEIKKRIGRSPDKFDSLSTTFYPGKKITQAGISALSALR